ncbi:ImmA/IrrE family metallo-endopeptidase [Streptomyces sp. LS1784]|uniref:ImmA/IrrE family metallo-endopeptidase n=1 Tax=Streptomyces sp. LS1784 TaxID=2851533 RepID=UPI001CC95B3A|nr:ImmA/IrrE family metallo-endopeptidase [Streptomyces sp. LS1784]
MPTAVGNAAEVAQQYDPLATLEQMGIPVIRQWLRDTWGAWSPRHRVVILAQGLSPTQERCVLAHEIEHILAGDVGCGGMAGLRAERLADLHAARKLVALSDFCAAVQWATSEAELAAELGVTGWILRTRAADLEGGAQWLGTSKTGG